MRNKIKCFVVSAIFLTTGLFTSFSQESYVNEDSLQYLYKHYQFEEIVLRTDLVSDTRNMEYRAMAFRALKRHREAIELYKLLLGEDSLNILYHSELADSYEALGDYSSSLRQYRKLVYIDSSNNYFIRKLADALYLNNKAEAASHLYLSCLTPDSSHYILVQLARCYSDMEITDSAISWFGRAVKKEPGDFFSSYRLADIYKEKGDYSRGIEVAEAYLARDSFNVRMLKLSGFMSFMNKDYDMANLKFETCASRGDSSDFLNRYYGYSLFRTRDYDPAKTFLEKAFFKDSLNANLCFALGVSCYSSYYKKLGVTYLEKAIKLLHPDPAFLATVYNELSNAYSGNYRYDEALDALYLARKANPTDTVLIFRIASHYDERMNNPEKALEYYRSFLETRPEKGSKTGGQSLPGMFVVSYYDFAERRIREIEEELFWKGDGN